MLFTVFYFMKQNNWDNFNVGLKKRGISGIKDFERRRSKTKVKYVVTGHRFSYLLTIRIPGLFFIFMYIQQLLFFSQNIQYVVALHF